MVQRPVLVVPFARGAATPWEIVEAAGDRADVVFVHPEDSPDRHDLLAALRESAPTLVASGPRDVVAGLSGRTVCGVLTFSDRTLALSAALAEAFGCDFHSAGVAAALTDKLAQRRLLRAGEVATPRLAAPARADDLAAAVAGVGVPCVIKPRRSHESRHTYRLDDLADVPDVAAATAPVWQALGGFLVEELLRGDPRFAGPGWGCYVSVESIVAGGTAHHIAVVGKLPLREPFREAGHFFPSTLAPETVSEVKRVAAQAIAALGIRHGACQTEIMLTAGGPRVIEVNGRLGGFVADVVKLATGASLLDLTVAAAMGERSLLERLPTGLADPAGVGFAVFGFPAPDQPAAGTVDKVRGLRHVRRLPGVTAVVPAARRGDRLDTSMGTGSSVAHVYGLVADHEELARLAATVTDTIQVDFRPAP